MSASRLIRLIILPVLLALAGSACAPSPAGTLEENEQTALQFVKSEATFRFDGIPETLDVNGTASVSDGWRYTIEFDSRNAGYGNRSGQILARVITHHVLEVIVREGRVTEAVMDGVWDMVDQRTVDEMEISLAPIHEVEVYFMESFPVQVGVHIKGGLRDGCTAYHNAAMTVEGSVINIYVTTRHPRDVFCPAIYTYFEKDINLGSDFMVGTTYTLKVNDFITTFTY